MNKLRNMMLGSVLLLVTGAAVLYLSAYSDVYAFRAEVERAGGKVWLTSECDKNGTPNGAFVKDPIAYVIEILSLPTVCAVDLHDTKISKLPSGIARYSSIRCLILSDTLLNDDEVEHLIALDGALKIDICNTRITPEGAERLRTCLPNTLVIADCGTKFKTYHEIEFEDIDFEDIKLDILLDP